MTSQGTASCHCPTKGNKSIELLIIISATSEVLHGTPHKKGKIKVMCNSKIINYKYV